MSKHKKREVQAKKLCPIRILQLNIGTSLKGKGKSKEEELPIEREPSTVSMEDIEHTKVQEVISTTPSSEEINNWTPEHNNRVDGSSFLSLTEEKLLKHPFNLVDGQAYEIARLIKLLKGKEDPSSLHEIVKNAVVEANKEKSFELISISKLSLTKMNKIEKAMGLSSISIAGKDFPDPSSYIECNGFKWDMNKDEDKQMQDVKDWFKIELNLGEDYTVEDVHKDTKNEVTLNKAYTILRELKSEGYQVKGKLLIANANIGLDVLIVLTDCNEKWSLFFIIKEEEQYFIVIAKIDDRGKALGIINDFVLEQGVKFNKILGTNLRAVENDEIKIGPLSKKAKYIEVVEFCDERMLDIIPDMTDDELKRMNTRWRLRMLEKSIPINEKPIIQRYISAFSDDYENYETS
ncbi:21266_t:CDS:2 [Dentiscutata erythropus]|uniref:21266_t:CDS:1 n=1 Tax=Dentiscutata erythropus TaxID=1348616 RepID=A0A9N8W2R8_9GLOM|nr:21266_t:CDS:2 [Dentiscutata erythropus]